MDHSRSYLDSENVRQSLRYLYDEIEKLERKVRDLEDRVEDLEQERR